jgi:hypothetical protein
LKRSKTQLYTIHPSIPILRQSPHNPCVGSKR